MKYHSCGCTNDIQDPEKRLVRLKNDRLRYQMEILKMIDQIHIFTHEIEEIEEIEGKEEIEGGCCKDA
jgi:hypothetical protein